MNTDKLAINWQNFARARLQLKFAFIKRPCSFLEDRRLFSSQTERFDSMLNCSDWQDKSQSSKPAISLWRCKQVKPNFSTCLSHLA